MKTQMKRTLKMVGLLVIVLVLGIGITAKASTVTPRSIEASKTVSLSLNSGTATSSCKVSGKSGEVTKISINMYLKKKNNSGTWDTKQSWGGTKSSYYYNMTKTSSISKGTYRVKAKVICYQGSSSETTYHYSASKTY